MDEKVKQRFFSKVNKTDSCWLWTSSLFAGGYGAFSIKKNTYKAHRVSWILSGNTIPEGNVIRHKCRNKNCVNPDHLETGTNAENSADMLRDGTSPKGMANPKSKLTENQVLEIRERANESKRQLGEEFGVSRTTVSRILLRKIWNHI